MLTHFLSARAAEMPCIALASARNMTGSMEATVKSVSKRKKCFYVSL